jgi:hypothetical protein
MATSLGASFLVPIFQHKMTRKVISALLFAFALSLTFNLLVGNT